MSETVKNLVNANAKQVKETWFVITLSPEQRQTFIGRV
jgi:hypothetical protein